MTGIDADRHVFSLIDYIQGCNSNRLLHFLAVSMHAILDLPSHCIYQNYAPRDGHAAWSGLL